MNDELKELLKNAKSEEEARKILEAHRDELTDADLDNIAGGSLIPEFSRDCYKEQKGC